MQKGIIPLFKTIQKMGYKFVYLSARPAAMGTKTRNFLKRSRLPIGPVLLSREKLWKAFKTATTNPEKIKIHGLIELQVFQFLFSNEFSGNFWWKPVLGRLWQSRNGFNCLQIHANPIHLHH